MSFDELEISRWVNKLSGGGRTSVFSQTVSERLTARRMVSRFGLLATACAPVAFDQLLPEFATTGGGTLPLNRLMRPTAPYRQAPDQRHQMQHPIEISG